MKNFWKESKKPIFCLAPMADVTDCVFRRIIARYGKPDIFWTEFVSADGLAHPEARKKLLIDLKYTEAERPIVAQIFGANPENIRSAAALCKKLGFDGIDINMGCPDRSIEKQGAGAATIKNPALATNVIRAAGECGLPVSVKTRLGYNKIDLSWIEFLLKQNLSALTVHLRTRKEMSDVPAHWELMKEIVELRNKISPDTLILGNGDVENLEDARKKIEETGCDGIMLGRAIFGNPWLFTSPPAPLLNKERGASSGVRSIEERLRVMVEHTKLFEKLLMHPAKDGASKNFAIMKKHYKAYVNGWEGAKELRMKLMGALNAKQVKKMTDDFLGKIE